MKYNFKKTKYSSKIDLLVCPDCSEELLQVDIVAYSRCPFCDYEFLVNHELEDYLLQPAVNYFIDSHFSSKIHTGHILN